MINLDKLGEIKLERISPALNRKKWNLPLGYESEYLGGFYDNPVSSIEEPVGIGLNYGSKTGDKVPVTLELGCTKGVLLPGARHISHEFCEPAARRANELCRQLGLPPVLGELASNPHDTWQSAFPGDKCRLVRGYKSFGVLVEGQDTLLSVTISSLPPLSDPRYVCAEIFDLKRVTKNCPKREQAEILEILRKSEDLIQGNALLDAADFTWDKISQHWTWRFPIHNPLGAFRLELPVGKQSAIAADGRLFAAAMDLVLSAEEHDDYIQELVYGDYHRYEAENPEALAAAGVPTDLRRKAMRDYVSDRALIVQPDTKGEGHTGIVRVRPRWRGNEVLILQFNKGKIAAVDGKAFKLKDQVLWCQGDKKLKPKPVGTISPEFRAMAEVIRLMGIQIEKAKAPRPQSSSLKKLLVAAEAAGFIHLGWLEVTMPLPLTIAAFSNADGGIFLSIATSLLLEKESVDLVSHLDNNRKLTTTNFQLVMPQPERGIFKYSHPKAELSQLLRKHNDHLRELQGEIATRVKTLADFERAIREHLTQENQR